MQQNQPNKSALRPNMPGQIPDGGAGRQHHIARGDGEPTDERGACAWDAVSEIERLTSTQTALWITCRRS
jgi:hypothetical protein